MTRNSTSGRLNREENPQSGTVPGFTPQYFENDGHARNVSEDYPYPVRDGDVLSKLESIVDKQADIIEKLEGTLKTEVTGSYVEHSFVTGGFARYYGETADSISSAIPFSILGKRQTTVFVKNDSDDACGGFRLVFYAKEPDDMDDSIKEVELSNLSAGTEILLTVAEHPELKDINAYGFAVRFQNNADEVGSSKVVIISS